MFTESEIIIGTMLELMHSYGIPCFSVHDSIIVLKSDQQIAMKTHGTWHLGQENGFLFCNGVTLLRMM